MSGDVPKCETMMLSGLATPIAYETYKQRPLHRTVARRRLTCTRQRLHTPAFTKLFATQRAAYAPERSTFVGSLPESFVFSGRSFMIEVSQICAASTLVFSINFVISPLTRFCETPISAIFQVCKSNRRSNFSGDERVLQLEEKS